MVNLDVARVLNKVIKKPKFERLTLAIQASDETSDILIPNRKRGEFYQAVIDGAAQAEKDKVLLALPDKRYWEYLQYHPGMHSKTLIVDDEIAIIGSATSTSARSPTTARLRRWSSTTARKRMPALRTATARRCSSTTI